MIRDGIYLEDNPPARSQFRVGRRDPVKPVIVVHTAESGTDTEGPDPKAENVARFIRRRSTAGSYHLLGDADSIIQLVRFENEAYGDRTGSNRWAIHISLAMNAGDWPSLPPERRDALTRTAAWMARYAADWLQANGHGRPPPVLLSKQESDRRDASGFISHARRDPTRRTDPGPAFPWEQFFDYYRNGDTTMATINVPDPHVVQIQEICERAGYPPGPHDGIPGSKTAAAVLRMEQELTRRRGEAAVDDDTRKAADLWRRYRAALTELELLGTLAKREIAKENTQ